MRSQASDVQFLKGGQARLWVQVDPTLPPAFYGCAALDGLTQSLGDLTPEYCPSSVTPNTWEIVDTTPSAPELPSGNIVQKVDLYMRDGWRRIAKTNCFFTGYLNIGNCNRPDDPLGWESKVILHNTRLTSWGFDGTFNPESGGDNATIKWALPVSMQEFYIVTPISFGESADSVVLADILDGLYFDAINCGDCGTPSDGSNKLYFLAQANTGSPGLSSQLVRTINGGSSWVALDIPVLGGTSANRIIAMGNRLLVLSQNLGGYAWATFENVDAGTSSNIWTAVTSGFVAGKAPRAGWSKSSVEAYLAAAGGYVYFLNNAGDAPSRILTDGSITSQNLNDIHGAGQTIVAVGDSNALIRSFNGGDNFTLVTGPAVGVNLNAIWVVSKGLWFVGTGNGKLYRTIDSGTTWTQVSTDALSVINDIRFYDSHVGYFSAEVGGAGRVYRTTDSGATWEYTSKIKGLPTNQRINVVVPNPYDANIVAVGGRKTVGGDGLIAIAR